MGPDTNFSTDRYGSVGIPHPDVKTMCHGQCEGLGVFPVYMAEGDRRDPSVCLPRESQKDPTLIALWRTIEAETPSSDGYHFVTCPDCAGSGLAA